MNSDRQACSSHTQWINYPCVVLFDPDRLSFELVSFSPASNYMQQGLSYEADSSSVGQAIFRLTWYTKLHPPVYETLPVDTTLYQLRGEHHLYVRSVSMLSYQQQLLLPRGSSNFPTNVLCTFHRPYKCYKPSASYNHNSDYYVQ